MKREIPTDQTFELPFAKLHLEDIRELCKVVEPLRPRDDHEQQWNPLRICVNNDLIIESPDDVDSLAETIGAPRLSSLEIRKYGPDLSLYTYQAVLGGLKCTLRFSRESNDSVTAASAIQGIFERRRRNFSPILSQLCRLLYLVAIVSPFFGSILASRLHIDFMQGVFIAFVLGWTPYIAASILKERFGTVFLLTSRLAPDTFWERNKDKIILAGLSALLGIGSTLLAQAISKIIQK